MTRTLRSSLLLLLLLHPALLAAQAASASPAAIGTRVWELVDSTRTMPAADGRRLPRRVKVQAWYPAGMAPGLARAPRLPEWQLLGAHLSATGARHGQALTSSYLDAPIAVPATGLVPVLLMSHALGGRRTDYTLTAEALAGDGFVVVAVDHPGGAGAIAWRDGLVTVQDPRWGEMSPPEQPIQVYHAFTDARMADWARDLQLVLDRWDILWPALPGSRVAVGAFGHSNGGKAVTALCADRPEVRACANLDGWPVPAAVEVRGLDQPYLLIEDVRDASEAEFREWGSSLDEYTRNMDAQADRRTRMLRTMRAPSARIAIHGIRHGSFTDWPSLDPAFQPDGARLAPDSALGLVHHALRAFFREHLLGERQELFHPPADVTIFDRSRWLTP